VKKKITTIIDKADAKEARSSAADVVFTAEQANIIDRTSVRNALHRYCSIALITAATAGSAMMLFGLRPMGKGLILGAVFSVINFILMATALPIRIGLGRKKAFLFSLGSIQIRYALMAVPLVISLKLKQDLFAVSTVAVGLFMVQLAILGDQLWMRLRNPERVKC
jgi:hypothetical protein